MACPSIILSVPRFKRENHCMLCDDDIVYQPIRLVVLSDYLCYCQSVCASFRPSVLLSVYLCFCQSDCASVSLTVLLSVCLVLLSDYLCFCQTVCGSVSLSVVQHCASHLPFGGYEHIRACYIYGRLNLKRKIMINNNNRYLHS